MAELHDRIATLCGLSPERVKLFVELRDDGKPGYERRVLEALEIVGRQREKAVRPLHPLQYRARLEHLLPDLLPHLHWPAAAQKAKAEFEL